MVVATPRPTRLVLALAAALGLLAPSAVSAHGAPRPRVALVTFDCTAGSFLCPSFERAMRRTGVRGRIISPDPREDPVATLSFLAAEGYDPVIVDANHADGLATAAARFPKTRFVLFDASLASVHVRLPNVQAIIAEPRKAAYLAGWLAARYEMRRRGPDVIGAVGGLSIPSVNDFITGYTAGAKHADTHVTVLRSYSRDFVDPNKCEALARTQIAHGAGVVFNVAGACGLGTLAAAKREGVWAIGVDTDQSNLGAFVLTSVIKRYDAGFTTLFREVVDGTLQQHPGTTTMGMREGGAELGPISPRVPAALRAGLEQVRRQILDGRLIVPGAPPG
jgi:basic membrane protein A and related proteins